MMIRKRDGRLVNYDGSKIVGAVAKAMKEVSGKVDKEICYKVEEEVKKTLEAGNYPLTVEGIQDSVENTLMSLGGCNEVAKAYILYRAKRNEERGKPSKYKYLSDSFLKPYRQQKDSFQTELGKMVYKRTYARPIPKEHRREDWWETVARVVDFSTDLEVIARKKQGQTISEVKRQELINIAERMYKHIFHLGLFPSGRSLWVGGTASAYEYSLSNFNCFSRDTEFITDKGIKSFKEFEDEDKVKVLNANGAWSEATVKNFGIDEIVEIKLRKGRSIKTIKTTNNHIWYVHKGANAGRYIEKETHQLKPGDYLREKRRYEKQNPVPCKVGIQHGIVYGDGTFDKGKNFCSVSLVGEKQELLQYMTTGSKVDIGNGEQTRVYGLPNNWKKFPNTEEMNLEYLYGFLIGYFATDGSVTNNQHRISSSKKEDLELVKDICSLVGKSTGEIRVIREVSPFDGSYAPLYEMVIFASSITDEFLINSKHRANSKFNGRTLFWKVESVTPTGKEEPVWCVQEPITQSFTLADDILTHNCSFVTIDEFEKFSEMFFVLMLGTGVGLSVERKYVEQLPKVNTDIRVIHKAYTPIPKKDRLEYTEIEQPTHNMIKLNIGDSKFGWSEAMKYYLDIITKKQYKDIEVIVVNYDSVRPKGERLKTFGGYASGHENLKTMFEKIDGILEKLPKGWQSLKPIHALDIATIIAENVISGGRI